MKKILVCGAGGFIGGHLVHSLQADGHWVRGCDLKEHEYYPDAADDFVIGDLRDPRVAEKVVKGMDEIYQLAADMGGAGFIFTGENDADVMHNSVLCNLNVLDAARAQDVNKIFYSSSACVYPEHNQLDPKNPTCVEASAYPAAPDSEYGWEKLFSERLYLSYQRNYNMQVRIARYHNVFGPEGTWRGGREKSPAAICRKTAEENNGGNIDIWGDGLQTRSFLYIDECITATKKLMASHFSGPVNIGSEEMVTINELAQRVMKIAGKKVTLKHVPGPLGVRGRTSDNKLIQKELNWGPSSPLNVGLEKTYAWIAQQVTAAAVV